MQAQLSRQERAQPGRWQPGRRRSSPVWRRRGRSRSHSRSRSRSHSRSRSRSRSRSKSNSPELRRSFDGHKRKEGKKFQNRKGKTPVKSGKGAKTPRAAKSKKENQGLGCVLCIPFFLSEVLIFWLVKIACPYSLLLSSKLKLALAN